jgi:hypothetical protein
VESADGTRLSPPPAARAKRVISGLTVLAAAGAFVGVTGDGRGATPPTSTEPPPAPTVSPTTPPAVSPATPPAVTGTTVAVDQVQTAPRVRLRTRAS